MVRGNACSGNTAAHTAPLPTAALRQCLIGTFLHRQRFSDVQCFCAPCRFPCFPVAVGLAQRKPPYGSVSMGDSWESFFKVTPVYNSRGLPSGGLQKLLPPDAFSSGSRPHPGTAGPQATAYAVDTLADDSRSYSRLISGSGCRSLTCRIQQRKQHPMRWGPFRMISLAECKPLRHG